MRRGGYNLCVIDQVESSLWVIQSMLREKLLWIEIWKFTWKSLPPKVDVWSICIMNITFGPLVSWRISYNISHCEKWNAVILTSFNLDRWTQALISNSKKENWCNWCPWEVWSFYEMGAKTMQDRDLETKNNFQVKIYKKKLP